MGFHRRQGGGDCVAGQQTGGMGKPLTEGMKPPCGKTRGERIVGETAMTTNVVRLADARAAGEGGVNGYSIDALRKRAPRAWPWLEQEGDRCALAASVPAFAGMTDFGDAG